MSAHGTVSRYTNERCRCEDCRRANAIYRAHYKRGRRTRQLVFASESRRHLRFLLTHGWTGRRLALHLQLDRCTIQAIAAGTKKKIDRKTADRILGCTIIDAPYAGKRVGGRKAEWLPA